MKVHNIVLMFSWYSYQYHYKTRDINYLYPETSLITSSNFLTIANMILTSIFLQFLHSTASKMSFGIYFYSHFQLKDLYVFSSSQASLATLLL